jgi:hypothetical protein
MKKRLLRRLQKKNKAKKRKERFAKWLAMAQPDPYREIRQAGINAETPTRCSCYSCGNPRRHSKGKDRVTIQERTFNEDFISVSELAELLNQEFIGG